MPSHDTEAKRNSWSWSTTESTEAGPAYCFVLFPIHPTASFASASHSQAAWAPLPPPPPLMAPTSSHNQQPEGHHQVQQQRDAREESEARIVNNILPESRHIYWSNTWAQSNKTSYILNVIFIALAFMFLLKDNIRRYNLQPAVINMGLHHRV
jgi:hypothetical protein